jgi:hypothetical protein
MFHELRLLIVYGIGTHFLSMKAVPKFFREHFCVILSAAFPGSDVDWVLAGSGSLSSGSARSRGQLIAAQRLDPHGTLFPKADDASVVRVKKGNPWTERKEVVAAGLGVRVHSAGQQQMAPVDTEKSSVSAEHASLYHFIYEVYR